MIVCLTIGAECSGQDYCRKLLDPFLKDEAKCRLATNTPEVRTRDIWFKKDTPAQVKLDLQAEIAQLESQGVTHFYEDTSFPFLLNRLAPTYPSLNELLDLFEGHDVRILLLKRDPVESTASVLRRVSSANAVTDIYNEAAITSRTISILYESVFRQNINFKFIEFNSMLSNPQQTAKALSSYFSMPVVHVATQNSRQQSIGSSYLGEFQVGLLHKFFRLKRNMFEEMFPKESKLC